MIWFFILSWRWTTLVGSKRVDRILLDMIILEKKSYNTKGLLVVICTSEKCGMTYIFFIWSTIMFKLWSNVKLFNFTTLFHLANMMPIYVMSMWPPVIFGTISNPNQYPYYLNHVDLSIMVLIVEHRGLLPWLWLLLHSVFVSTLLLIFLFLLQLVWFLHIVCILQISFYLSLLTSSPSYSFFIFYFLLMLFLMLLSSYLFLIFLLPGPLGYFGYLLLEIFF